MGKRTVPVGRAWCVFWSWLDDIVVERPIVAMAILVTVVIAALLVPTVVIAAVAALIG